MRLTLRTMLAYLDDLLEPADREEIGRKIEENEFARQLVERIRESTRNSKISAARALGKGIDANTVAEYLDNTLASERVPEFEKLCLDQNADVYLAEAASCHQILTMVLGQPAQVDPQMRRRMYAIGQQQEVKAGALGAPGEDGLARGTLDDFEIRPGRRKPEVPDYLRQPVGRIRWKPIIAGIALLLLLAGAITMALGPLDRTNPVVGWMFSGPQQENQVAQHGPAPPAKEDVTPAVQPSPTAEGNPETSRTADAAPKQDETPAALPPAGQAPTDNAAVAKGPSNPATPPDKSVASEPTPSSSVGTAAPTMERPSPINETTTLPPPVPQPTPEGAAMPSPVTDVARAATAPAANPTMPGPSAPAAGAGSLTPAGGAAIPPIARKGSPSPEEKSLGKLLLSKDTVLLRVDPKTGDFTRVPPGGTLMAADVLLALPTYRPTLTLSGLTLYVAPDSVLQLLPMNADVQGVKLLAGHLVAVTTGSSQLRLDFGPVHGTVTFADPNATLGVEVRRVQQPGADPETQEPHIAADLYAIGGQIDWATDDGASTSLKAGQRWSVPMNPAEAASPPVNTSTPKWIQSEQLNSTDADASRSLAMALDNDKPLLVALSEMAGHRRAEYKSLAARCLGLVDQFEPLSRAFNDEGQRSMWPNEIASIRAALCRGPATAAKVRETFQKQYGDGTGKDLYRMFWGYTNDQLQGGEAAKLVDAIENEMLEFRVLGFANLQEITGKTFLYRPDSTTTTRTGPVTRWREELRQNHIVHVAPPAAK